MTKGHDKGHKGQMSDREVMKLALEALNRSDYLGWQLNIPIIKALRERLAQPEQKPFCYHDGRNIVGKEYADHSDVFPLYTAPPTQPERTVSLEEYKRLQRLVTNQGIRLMEYESKQEPVACKHNRYSVDVHEQTGTCYDCGAEGRMRFVVYETTPPKREWVGLTDEEIYAVIRPLCNDDTAARMLVESSMDEYRAIEAKLKEKNT